MKGIDNPLVEPAGKAVHLGFKKTLQAILILALTAALTACNLRPISRSLTSYGYMDTTGHIVIPMQFKNAMHFSEGLAAANRSDRLGGYIRG